VAVVVADSLLAQREGLALALTEWGPDVVIWDEAHRGKTYGSRRSEAVLQLTHDCRAQGIAVTGTPMLKSPAELAPLMEFTGQDVSVFGGLRQLLDHTCTLDRYGRLRPSRKGEDWLQQKLSGEVMIRRTKAQVSPQLPPKHRYPIYIDAPMAEFNRAHKEINQKIDTWLKEWRKQHGALPDHEAILDYANGNLGYISQLRRAAGVCKVPVAEVMIAQHIAQTRSDDGTFSDPLIVWTHHKEVTEVLATKVPDIDGAAMIIGGMNRQHRDHLIDEFQAGRVGALVCSTHAAGVAITLTRCHSMLFVETDWTPGIVVQAEDRAHRTGQTADQVSIGTLVCQGTLDPIVQATLHRKAQFLDATIGGDNSVYVDEDDDLTATDVLVNLIQARVGQMTSHVRR
jgi:SNF2 family DNA or RNA helicase